MKKILTIVLTGLIGFQSCKEKEVSPIDLKKQVIENYANIVLATYTDSYEKAKELQTKIVDFTAAPTAAKFTATKQAWLDARIPYGQTEGFRFYGGPIDNDEGPEGLINGWPMDESYVDYVQGDDNTGIINDVAAFPTITKEILLNANENGSETNIATGWHAIEYLLWGQDFNANGPGQRAYTDYLTIAGTAKNQARRAQYLKIATDLLVQHLGEVRDQWTPNGRYRIAFLAQSADETIAKILRGIATLSKGELAGERMTVAFANQDQEDEHSCFSDNTHVDIYMNFKSIQNVYNGTYTSTTEKITKGASFSDLFTKISTESDLKNKIVIASLSETNIKTKLIFDTAPFDKLIMNDASGKINSSINALRKLSDQIVDAAFSIGIKVDNELE